MPLIAIATLVMSRLTTICKINASINFYKKVTIHVESKASKANDENE